MSSGSRGPTLTDVVGMGGVIAQDGFDYQAWQGIVRLPAWLRNPAFEALIFEGLEDLEARFFAPHAPSQRLLERYQAKSGALTPQEVKDVFKRFLEFEQAYPRITRVHTLVTPQLPATLKWIARDAARVRQARPFYSPFASVAGASDAKFADDAVAALGEQLGSFVAEGVDCVEHPLPSRAVAVSSFGSALHDAYPELDLSFSRHQAAFGALEALATRSKGNALSRSELTNAIEEAVSRQLLPQRAFHIHVRSEHAAPPKAEALEIEASAFSGGSSPFPQTSEWSSGLIAPLQATADWLKQQNVQRIALSGSYRISTAFAVGHSFRSAVGFELEIPTRDGAWATDDRPLAATVNGWSIKDAQVLHRGRLVVAVGILRRPREDLVYGGVPATAVLDCFLGQPVTSAKEAQVGASCVKEAISHSVSRLRPTGVDLYVAGPAAFAVVLGHRWNAMPTTQLHEFDSTRRLYVDTASLC